MSFRRAATTAAIEKNKQLERLSLEGNPKGYLDMDTYMIALLKYTQEIPHITCQRFNSIDTNTDLKEMGGGQTRATVVLIFTK